MPPMQMYPFSTRNVRAIFIYFSIIMSKPYYSLKWEIKKYKNFNSSLMQKQFGTVSNFTLQKRETRNLEIKF